MHFLLISLTLFFTIWSACSYALMNDPYQIMRDHYEAIGGLDKLKKITSSYSEGEIRYDGLQGKFKSWEAGPLQYRTEENYTVISQVQGDSGTSAWLLDTNGQLLIFRDEETLKRRRISVRLDRYEHLDPNSPYFSLSFEGTKSVNGHTCYEIVLANTINDDTSQFFLDIKSLYLIQSVIHQPDMKMITRYDDFRWIDNILIPFFKHSLYLPREKVEETRTSLYTINKHVDASLFSVPVPVKDYHIETQQKSASLSFLFIENLIYLPVTIKNDTRYWVLDTGASMSVIDLNYAQSLGLKIKGSIKGYGFGELFELSFAKIPEFQVGPIRFNAQTFFVSKDLTKKSYEPEIYGILGYDFLSRFIVEINYDTQNITLHTPESFVYNGSGIILDAPLKYRTFSLPVTLDGKYTSRWTLDLGSYQSSIHYPFAQKYGLLDLPGVESVSQGMSGISFERTTRFSCLSFGSFQLDAPLIAIPVSKGKGATALGEVGGNMGNSTLRNFHLFLDYPEQKIILEAGKNFNTRLPQDTSGIIIGKGDNNQPMVSYIARHSPGTAAGLRAGDIIVAMAGNPVTTDSKVVPLRKLLRDNIGKAVAITVKREGKLINTNVILKELYQQNNKKCAAGSNTTPGRQP